MVPATPESFILPLPSHEARFVVLPGVPETVANVVVLPLAAPEDRPLEPLPMTGKLLLKVELEVTTLAETMPESFAFPLASHEAK